MLIIPGIYRDRVCDHQDISPSTSFIIIRLAPHRLPQPHRFSIPPGFQVITDRRRVHLHNLIALPIHIWRSQDLLAILFRRRKGKSRTEDTRIIPEFESSRPLSMTRKLYSLCGEYGAFKIDTQ